MLHTKHYKGDLIIMSIVKTWCENTKEGIDYLRFNGYKNAIRILNTNLYVCRSIGNQLSDVTIIK